MKTQTYQPAELHTFTPELGLFVVTGTLQDVQEAAGRFERMKVVRASTFDKWAGRGPVRKQRKHLIELALF